MPYFFKGEDEIFELGFLEQLIELGFTDVHLAKSVRPVKDIDLL